MAPPSPAELPLRVLLLIATLPLALCSAPPPRCR